MRESDVFLYRRYSVGNSQCLVNVQFTGFPVLVLTVIVINTVSDVRVLLDLGYHNTLANGMECA